MVTKGKQLPQPQAFQAGYISRNAYLGCIKDDECPGNKPDCRSGVCIKGLFNPMSKEGGEGSLPSVGCLFT